MKDKNKKNPFVPIIINYVVLCVASLLILGLQPVRRFLDINGIYTAALVRAVSKLNTFLGIPGVYRGPFIYLPNVALEVKFGCNGLEAVIMYCMAVIVYPSRWRIRLTGIAAGFIVIEAVNILRISGLSYVGVYHFGFFETAHYYIAQGMMIAFSLGLLIVYLSFASRADKRDVR